MSECRLRLWKHCGDSTIPTSSPPSKRGRVLVKNSLLATCTSAAKMTPHTNIHPLSSTHTTCHQRFAGSAFQHQFQLILNIEVRVSEHIQSFVCVLPEVKGLQKLKAQAISLVFQWWSLGVCDGVRSLHTLRACTCCEIQTFQHRNLWVPFVMQKDTASTTIGMVLKAELALSPDRHQKRR